jgi:hypothetical protein
MYFSALLFALAAAWAEGATAVSAAGTSSAAASAAISGGCAQRTSKRRL